MRTKLHILRCNILLLNVDYFILTETWLSADILDSELSFGKLNTYRGRSDKKSTYKKGDDACIHVGIHKRVEIVIVNVPKDNIEYLFILKMYM